MRKAPAVLARLAAAGVLLAAAHRPPPPRPERAEMQKLTPVLIVDEVEPCARFWTERLGFATQFEVPHGGRLGFVGLVKGDVEVMIQSRASVADDIPALAEGAWRSALFVEVEDLDEVERALAGADVVQPRRTTFYGMTEIGVREPCGNVVVFAQRTGEEGA